MLPGVERPDLPLESQPVPEVVALAEQVLIDAKNGKIRVLGVACVLGNDGETAEGWAPKQDAPATLSAAAADLHYRVTKMRNDTDARLRTGA